MSHKHKLYTRNKLPNYTGLMAVQPNINQGLFFRLSSVKEIQTDN